MKIACACFFLLFGATQIGVCQKTGDLTESDAKSIARTQQMQDKLSQLDDEVKRLRDKMSAAEQTISSSQTQAQDNAKDIAALKYLGGGLVFIAGVFIAELVRRIATRVTFQSKSS